MGLDAAEIVMDVEQHFQITIRREDMVGIFTVGEFYEHVLSKLTFSPECPHLGTFVFERLRQTLVNRFQIPLDEVIPNARLARLLPWWGRRAAWKQLGEALELRLPPLERPQWFVTSVTVVSGTALLVLLASVVHVPVWTSVLVGSSILMWTWKVWTISTPLERFLPKSCTTVQQAVQTIHAMNNDTLHTNLKTWNPVEVWEVLVTIIQNIVGVPRERITPSAKFVEDLGC